MRLQSSLALFSGPVARGATISFAIRLASIGLVTVQAILTARLLGAGGYGEVAFMLSLTTLFSAAALLGTEPLATREVARLQALDDPSALKGFLKTIRWLVVGAALLGALVWLWAATTVFANMGSASLAVFVALIFPLMAITLQTQGVLRGYGDVIGAQVPLQILRPLFVVGFLILAWSLSWDIAPSHYLIAVVVGCVLALILGLLLLRQRTERLRDTQAPSAPMGPLAKAAAPFFAISVIGLLGAEINTILLALWTTPEQTGLFQPIARITPLLLLAMQAISVRYGPRISELRAAGESARLARVTRQVTVSTTGFTLVAAVLLLGFAQPILGLFGPEFVVVAPALWWIAGAQLFNAACGPVGLLLSMSGQATRTVLPQLFGLLVNILVGAWLIPAMGAEGAAIAMAAGIVSWNLAMLISVRRHMGEDPSLLGLWRGRRATSD